MMQVFSTVFATAVLIGLFGILLLVLPIIRRMLKISSDADSEDEDTETCDHCGYDVRGGFLLCPECGQPTHVAKRRRIARLQNDWPAETISPRRSHPDEENVIVHETSDSMLASLLQQQLQARGVACRLEPPHAASFWPQGTHSCYLIVWSADLDRAKLLLGKLLDLGLTPAQPGNAPKPETLEKIPCA